MTDVLRTASVTDQYSGRRFIPGALKGPSRKKPRYSITSAIRCGGSYGVAFEERSNAIANKASNGLGWSAKRELIG